MKISSDDQKAISVILIYTALLFFLIGMAAPIQNGFSLPGRNLHGRTLHCGGVGSAGRGRILVLAGRGNKSDEGLNRRRRQPFPITAAPPSE